MNSERNVIVECFPSILSKTSYQFADLAPGDFEENPDQPGLQACLEFRFGKKTGLVGIQVPESFALQLAANIIGSDPDGDIDPTTASDSVGELVNIFAGQLLPILFGKDELFLLLSPVVTKLANKQWAHERKNFLTVPFTVDDEFAIFVMYRSNGN